MISLGIAIIVSTYLSFWLHAVTVVLDIVFLFAITVLNTKTLRILKERQATVKQGCNGFASNRDVTFQKGQFSAVRTIRSMLFASLFTYLPYNIVSPVSIFYKFKQEINPHLTLSFFHYICSEIVMGSGIVNSLIIIHVNTKFRKIIYINSEKRQSRK